MSSVVAGFARRAAGKARAYAAGVPAVATQAATAAGMPLMCDPLPGVPEAFAQYPATTPETKVTKLPSGMIVASEDSPGPAANVSLFVGAGSVHETAPGTAGASHALEKLAWTSTQMRSQFRIVRDAEVIGAHTSAIAGREHFTYSVDGVKGTQAALVEVRLRLLCLGVRTIVRTLKAHIHARRRTRKAGRAGHARGGAAGLRLRRAGADVRCGAQAARCAPGMLDVLRGAACTRQRDSAGLAFLPFPFPFRSLTSSALRAPRQMLMEGARMPAMHDWELAGAIERAIKDTKNSENSTLQMGEAMHSVAYAGKGLGRPLLATDSLLASSSPQAVAKFWGEHFTSPSRMVVAASGIDHDELVSLVEPFSGNVEGVASVESSASEDAPYVGGEWSGKSTDGSSHVNMVFETPGGWSDVDGAVTCTVLQAMLGGGFSFSSGGPGKGMYSRLYTGVLNQYAQVTMASVHGDMYDKTGLVGVSGTCEPGFEGRLVDILTAQLTDIAAAKFSDEELARARNSAISSMMTNLEKKNVVSEDIGRQLLAYGKRMPASTFIEKLNKVSSKNVAAYAKKMFATPLTYVTMTAGGEFPAYKDVAGRF